MKKLFVILSLIICLCSCGTYHAVIENPAPHSILMPVYLGVQYDILLAEFSSHSIFYIETPFWIMDIPFSFVADTILIPYYIYKD